MPKPLFYGSWNYKDPEAELMKCFPHRNEDPKVTAIRKANMALGKKYMEAYRASKE